MLKSMLLCAVALGAASTALAADPDSTRKNGYRLVNLDGEKRYCRTDFDTGSHVRTTTSCLTEKELQALQERSQLGLREITRAAPPPQGK